MAPGLPPARPVIDDQVVHLGSGPGGDDTVELFARVMQNPDSLP
ncbi:hypothetical protein ACODT5_17260 [Streptomyces sp. 5.8]